MNGDGNGLSTAFFCPELDAFLDEQEEKTKTEPIQNESPVKPIKCSAPFTSKKILLAVIYPGREDFPLPLRAQLLLDNFQISHPVISPGWARLAASALYYPEKCHRRMFIPVEVVCSDSVDIEPCEPTPLSVPFQDENVNNDTDESSAKRRVAPRILRPRKKMNNNERLIDLQPGQSVLKKSRIISQHFSKTPPDSAKNKISKSPGKLARKADDAAATDNDKAKNINEVTPYLGMELCSQLRNKFIMEEVHIFFREDAELGIQIFTQSSDQKMRYSIPRVIDVRSQTRLPRIVRQLIFSSGLSNVYSKQYAVFTELFYSQICYEESDQRFRLEVPRDELPKEMSQALNKKWLLISTRPVKGPVYQLILHYERNRDGKEYRFPFRSIVPMAYVQLPGHPVGVLSSENLGDFVALGPLEKSDRLEFRISSVLSSSHLLYPEIVYRPVSDQPFLSILDKAYNHVMAAFLHITSIYVVVSPTSSCLVVSHSSFQKRTTPIHFEWLVAEDNPGIPPLKARFSLGYDRVVTLETMNVPVKSIHDLNRYFSNRKQSWAAYPGFVKIIRTGHIGPMFFDPLPQNVATQPTKRKPKVHLPKMTMRISCVPIGQLKDDDKTKKLKVLMPVNQKSSGDVKDLPSPIEGDTTWQRILTEHDYAPQHTLRAGDEEHDYAYRVGAVNHEPSNDRSTPKRDPPSALFVDLTDPEEKTTAASETTKDSNTSANHTQFHDSQTSTLSSFRQTITHSKVLRNNESPPLIDLENSPMEEKPFFVGLEFFEKSQPFSSMAWMSDSNSSQNEETPPSLADLKDGKDCETREPAVFVPHASDAPASTETARVEISGTDLKSVEVKITLNPDVPHALEPRENVPKEISCEISLKVADSKLVDHGKISLEPTESISSPVRDALLCHEETSNLEVCANSESVGLVKTSLESTLNAVESDSKLVDGGKSTLESTESIPSPVRNALLCQDVTPDETSKMEVCADSESVDVVKISLETSLHAAESIQVIPGTKPRKRRIKITPRRTDLLKPRLMELNQ